MKMFFVTAFIVAALAAPIPFERRGVMSWNIGPPTAFWWPQGSDGSDGSMKVFESARFCDVNKTYWPPDAATGRLVPYSLNHSYFRIRDLVTGAVDGNVQGSERYAYGSAVVDPVTRRAWVFGSPRDLCISPHRAPGPDDNYVRAWWSDDLATWHTSDAPALRLPAYPFNTDVTPVVDYVVNGTRVNFVMVLEHGRVAVHSAADRNLTRGWRVHASPSGGFGACPAVHYGEDDGFLYVISGGNKIALARTRDLSTWESAPDLVVPDPDQDARVAPFMGMQAQVDDGAAAGGDARTLRAVLDNPYCWEYDVNDADFCCGGARTAPGAPLNKSYVLYSPSSQGNKPRANCSALGLAHTGFNGLATADVGLTSLLSSRFQ